MKVVYTEDALNDLDAIADWLIVHYPAVARAFVLVDQSDVTCSLAHRGSFNSACLRSSGQPAIGLQFSYEIARSLPIAHQTMFR
jgi:plasmid stabilization system protein ParE